MVHIINNSNTVLDVIRYHLVLECVESEFCHGCQDCGLEQRAPDIRCSVTQVLVARATVLNTYVGRGVYGARAIVAAAVRRPRT